MDEGRNVCLLFPESIEFGDSDDEEYQKFRATFEVSYVLSVSLSGSSLAGRDGC